jgi:hypothetical protein
MAGPEHSYFGLAAIGYHIVVPGFAARSRRLRPERAETMIENLA